jgi:hypothetical protein
MSSSSDYKQNSHGVSLFTAKSLYTHDGSMNAQGLQLNDEVYGSLLGIIASFQKEGYGIREIIGLVHGTVSAMESEFILNMHAELNKEDEGRE